MTQEKFEALKAFFKQDKYATFSGCEIDWAEEDACRCSMEITDMHLNGYGGIMGGAIMTLADFASAVVSNQDGAITVANNLNITFLGNSKEKKLFADAKIVKRGRSTTFVNIMVTDTAGKQIASVSILGFNLKGKDE